MTEEEREIIEIGLALIEEKFMEKGYSASDVSSIFDEYFSNKRFVV